MQENHLYAACQKHEKLENYLLRPEDVFAHILNRKRAELDAQVDTLHVRKAEPNKSSKEEPSNNASTYVPDVAILSNGNSNQNAVNSKLQV